MFSRSESLPTAYDSSNSGSTTEPSSHGGKKKGKVAIIGAGVAGCAMAAALRDYRIDFVVYDKNSKPGGLWADNYPGAKGELVQQICEVSHEES